MPKRRPKAKITEPVRRTLHLQLVQAAEEAIENLFSDTRVSQEETLNDLHDLRSQIEIKMQCIARDIKRKSEKELHA